ncbi:UDP-N-acetylmuramoyl-tripeptide--D-alanyl-D-alanine ligase [uncultured archaeon]|nr:UDP-N-acetylmuramoyl-tripeptide--D-alanyl-D-alanine ligase [uncultured archaeon]
MRKKTSAHFGKKKSRRAAPRLYAKALREIYALDKFGSRLGLEKIRAIMAALGNPQKNYRCVLVGGSNGKGSAAEMIASVLFEQGFKTGSYFSPQVLEFAERIRINGKYAAESEITDAYFEVKRACYENTIEATFFEVVTAMAFLIFARQGVDVAVLEVGLGGRLDATNCAEPSVSAITSISLEHTQVLGDTVQKIAHEKCGIARRGRKLVCGMLSEEAREAVRHECAFIGALPVFTEESVALHALAEKNGCYSFDAAYRGENYSVKLRAPGRFQVANACVALAVAAELGCGKVAVEKGISRTVPAFRMQALSSSPKVVADCGHNPEAAFTVASEVYKMREKPKILLFSAMNDKDYPQVLRIMRPHFDSAVLTHVPLARAASLSELGAAARSAGVDAISVKSPKKALATAKRLAGRKGLVVIAGSIYLISALKGKDKRLIGQ